MSLASIQSEILLKSKFLEICDEFQDVMSAATEEDLIDKGLGFVVYAYQAGIVDNTLLSSFTESKLNDANIYTTGSFSITNPSDEVYILKESVVDITINGTNKCKLTIMGSSSVTINAADDCYFEIKQYDSAEVSINLTNNARCKLTSNQLSSAIIIQEDDSLLHLNGRDNSDITLNSHNNSFTLARMYQASVLTYALSDTATITPSAFQNSTITDTALP